MENLVPRAEILYLTRLLVLVAEVVQETLGRGL
jgi:hypothetical protein